MFSEDFNEQTAMQQMSFKQKLGIPNLFKIIQNQSCFINNNRIVTLYSGSFFYVSNTQEWQSLQNLGGATQQV